MKPLNETELRSCPLYNKLIIIIPRQCLWCCHHGKAIARVHLVHLTNVERRQAAADPRPSQATWTVSPPVQAARVYTHHHHLLLSASLYFSKRGAY